MMNNLFHSMRRRHSDPPVREGAGAPPPAATFPKELPDNEAKGAIQQPKNASDELGSSDHASNGAARRRARRHTYSEPPQQLQQQYQEQQNFGRCQVSPGSHKVTISMDLPKGLNIDDLHVNLDDGVLKVEHQKQEELLQDDQSNSNSNSNNTTSSEESNDNNTNNSSITSDNKFFSLDEQVLDVKHAKAHLNSKGNVLNITVPKLDQSEVTKRERIPISTERPPDSVVNNKDKANSPLTILMDPPGVQLDDLYLHYSHGRLEISGGCCHRNFKRTVPIDVQIWDPDRIKAYFYKDVLVVIVPARQDHVAQDIDVKRSCSHTSLVRLSSRCSSEDLDLSRAVEQVDDNVMDNQVCYMSQQPQPTQQRHLESWG